MADGHEISVENAEPMTEAYRASETFQTYGRRIAIAFNKEAISRLIGQENVRGIRCYFAHDSKGMLTLVLAAYDEQNNDILRELAETGMPCPNFCSETNDLNS